MYYLFKSNKFKHNRGAVLVIAILLMVLLSIIGTLSIRSSNTFKKVVNAISGRRQVEEIARIGLARAIEEYRRRFSSMHNPAGTEPAANYQYRYMPLDSTNAISLVLQAYANDIYTLSGGGSWCTDSSLLSVDKDYGDDVNDMVACITKDEDGIYNPGISSLARYDYTVTLENRSAIQDCAINGFASAQCGNDGRTRLITQDCLNSAPAYNHASCRSPDSYQFGELDDRPELGYRLVIKSVATDTKTGRKATVTQDLLLFVRQMTKFDIATRTILIDGRALFYGGIIAGQLSHRVADEYPETRWYGYKVPTSAAAGTASQFDLGKAFGYNSYIMNRGRVAQPWLDYVNASLYNGMYVKEVISNVGIDPTFATALGNTADAMQIGNPAVPDPVVTAHAHPDDRGNYEAVFGATMPGMPTIVGPSGEFDEAALLAALSTADATLSTGAQMTADTSGGCNGKIFVSTGTTDQFTSVASITNNLATRNNRSIVIQDCIDVQGNVYIDGDLYTAGNLRISGQGNLIVRQNVGIGDDITYRQRPASATDANMANPASPYDYAANCPGNTCSSLGIFAVGNVVLGNISNDIIKSTIGTMVPQAATTTSVAVPPLDGLGPNPATDYADDFDDPARLAARKRNNNSNYGTVYKDLLQVGYGVVSAGYFPAVVSNCLAAYCPPYVPLKPEETAAVGVLPEGAGSSYGNSVASRTSYYFHMFRDWNPASATELPGWGLILNPADFAALPNAKDGYDRFNPGCAPANQCSPPGSLVGGDFAANSWGPGPASAGGAENPVITPITAHNLYFGGASGLNLVGNNLVPANPNEVPGFDAYTGMTTDATMHNTINAAGAATAGPRGVGLNSTKQLRSYLSATSQIDATIATAGILIGWGGNRTPRFWDPAGGPKPNLGTDNNYFDRDDLNSCAYFDCDGNGITFRGGVYGNIAPFTQGGIFVYPNNHNQAVRADDRMAIISSEKME